MVRVPISRRTTDQEQPDGGSLAGKGKARRKPKPTGKATHRKKKVKKRYSAAREEAQLAGVIPTTPDGAVHEERVDPARQVGAALPALVREALRECWATPDSAKPAIIAALLEPFYQDEVVVDENGKQVLVKPSRKMLMELARTLRVLDQTQWERDHPAEAGKARGGNGGTVILGDVVQNNIEAACMIREMIQRGQLGIIGEVQPSDKPGAPGGGGLERPVEAGAAPPNDKQRAGEGVAHT